MDLCLKQVAELLALQPLAGGPLLLSTIAVVREPSDVSGRIPIRFAVCSLLSPLLRMLQIS
jgi:hypothetical protein